MRKLYGLKFFVMLAIVLIPIFSGCNAIVTNTNGSKTEEIAELLKAVPVHPEKIEINTQNYASGSNTSITRKYKSDAPKDGSLSQNIKLPQILDRTVARGNSVGKKKRERVEHTGD